MLSHRVSEAARPAGLALAVALVSVFAVAGPAAAKNPPGNNGTVKIDAVAFDDHPNNEPHVGCTFQVDFYGFDEDPSYLAEVIFELHPPTRDGRTMAVTSGDLAPFIGEDDHAGGGSVAGLDASETYTLDFSGAPHPQQGYHVKLTIHAPGSQGADVKHKVFWVSGCGDPDPVDPGTPDDPGNPGTPDDPGQPPSGSSSTDRTRGGTASGAGGPPPFLPDTAMDPGTDLGPLMLLVALAVLSSPIAYAAVAVRRSRRRRR